MSAFLPLQDIAKRTIPDLLDRSQSFGLDRPLLIDLATNTTLSYGQFLEHVSGAAARLAARFKPGALIAVMLSNCREYVVLRYALSCAGLTEVALNSEHRGPILKDMLSTAKPAAIIVADRFAANVRECGYDLGGMEIIDDAGLAALYAETRPWADRPKVEVGPGTIGRVIFTSGTTGVSKGAQLSHAYECFTGERIIHRIGLGKDDRWLYVTPFFHVDGLIVMAALLHNGGSIVLAANFSASRFWDDAVASDATSFVYVGSILAILLKGEDPPKGHKIHNTVGGGCPVPIWEEFQSRFKINIVEAYAMTECIACVMNWNTEQRVGSVGKPYEGYEVSIVDQFDRPVPAGQKGEILIRSSEPWGFMSGYLNNPEATTKVVRNFWFHTGDLGSFDADGWMYYHGRIKDVIRRRGENISSEELETLLNTHPSVWISAAVGAPSELGEEDVFVYIQPKAGISVDPAEIARFIRERAAPFMVPKYIRLIEKMPLTPTEKVAKTLLDKKPDSRTWINPAVR